MSQSSAKLASLVGSRLCHDLISPIGAIQNGLELIALSNPGDTSPEMELIQDSCESASARIRFFRVAFGSAGSQQMMGQRDVLSTLSGLGKGGKTRFDWTPTEDLPRPEVQLAFLAYLCCESALPHGGIVRFERDAAGWSITAQGPRLSVDRPLWDHLNGSVPLDDPAADRVHFAMLPILAEARGQKLMTTLRDETITIKIA
ncbi:histidine phosphotransferase family protein [Antarctobacter jejuensis]|uniref:histidine phosphotransferase family protein n=1 Tax=Antarctobacter jejuensis TaxID=1439938 RepID=UPI003FD22727